MTTQALLNIEDLRITFGSGAAAFHPVDGTSLAIQRGTVHALIGESGCGKSLTALAALQLLPFPIAKVTRGSIRLAGQELLRCSEQEMRAVRGKRISMIFQEPMTSLNPVLTVRSQLLECLRHRSELSTAAREKLIVQALDEVRLPDALKLLRAYPHELSGGMKQRVMIAMALLGEPELLIADEPTTALDVTIQAQVLELLRGLQKSRNMSLLFITHDLGIAASLADEVSVMYSGEIVEHTTATHFFVAPHHPYSEKLMGSVPDVSRRSTKLAVIPGQVLDPRQRSGGCRFAERCDYRHDACVSAHPSLLSLPSESGSGVDVRCVLYSDARSVGRVMRSECAEFLSDANAAGQSQSPVLEVQSLSVRYPLRKAHPFAKQRYFEAVKAVDFSIEKSTTLALVGESGCGKTSAALAVARLVPHFSGNVTLEGREVRSMPERELRSTVQVIFQDPYNSMNPKLTARDIIAEPLICNTSLSKGDITKKVISLLEDVGLPKAGLDRYPNEFSGGQRQRIAIARALALSPLLIICDEPTSALDVSVQAQVLNLLKSLQREYGLSYLFITHNISVVEYIAHNVCVMYDGNIVEQGPAEALLQAPQHDYTKRLLSSAPSFEAPNTVLDIPELNAR